VLLTVAGLALIAPGTVSLLSGLVLCMLVLGLQALDPETARRLRI
jgi:UPF0716 family protein affecting phage T7 exclusion